MSKAEKIIESINNASEVEIMEYDFDDCFTYLREMENRIKNLMKYKRGSLPTLGNLNDNDSSRAALDELERLTSDT